MATRNTRIRGVQILDVTVTLDKIVSGSDKQLMIIGSGGVPAYQDVSGDITIGNTGIVAIGAEKVEEVMLECANAPDTAKVLGWNGSKLNWVEGITEANLVMNETVEPDTGSDVDYTLANTPVVDSVTVYLNGLLQQPGTGEDYIISGSTITFAEAVDASDIVLACYFVS